MSNFRFPVPNVAVPHLSNAANQEYYVFSLRIASTFSSQPRGSEPSPGSAVKVIYNFQSSYHAR